MDYYKKIERSVTISADKRSTVDLQVDVWSQDLNVTKFILKLDTTDSTTIDLTNATVRVAMVYNQDGQDVKIEASGIVEDVATQKIAYIMDDKLAGFEGQVTAGFYVTLNTGQRIDIQNVTFNMRKSLLDKDLEAATESYYQTFDDIVDDVQSAGNVAKTQIGQVLPDVQNQVAVLKSTLDTINETYPKIQASGINLWRYTKDYDGSKYDKWGQIWLTNITYNARQPVTTIDGFGVQYIDSAWDDMSQIVPIKRGGTYTLSAMIRLGNDTSYVGFYVDGGTVQQILVNGMKQETIEEAIRNLSSTEYKRVSVTFINNNSDLSYARFEPQSNSSMYIYQPMFNEGYPLPWEPNPNDITDTIATANSRLDNLNTGGENLIINGGFPTDTHGWVFNIDKENKNGVFEVKRHSLYFNEKKTIFCITNNNKVAGYEGQEESVVGSNFFNVKANTDYTLSFVAFTSGNISSTEVHYLGKNSYEDGRYTVVETLFGKNVEMSNSVCQYYQMTFNSGNSNVGYIRFDNNGSTDGTDCHMFFGEVMLVEGTVAKKYQPSSADLMLNSNPVNSILTTLSSENPSTILGGSWNQIGSESKFNQTIYYWQRTN